MAKFNELTEELSKAHNDRLEEAKKHRPSRNRRLKSIDLNSEEFKEAQKKRKAERMAQYSDKLKEALAIFESLTDDEKYAFDRESAVRIYSKPAEFENPQTTQKDLRELLEILVQTTIDFVNERGLKDLDAVGFSADSLQKSSKYSEWTPATDASIHVYGQEKKIGSNGNEYYVESLIGKYM